MYIQVNTCIYVSCKYMYIHTHVCVYNLKGLIYERYGIVSPVIQMRKLELKKVYVFVFIFSYFNVF